MEKVRRGWDMLTEKDRDRCIKEIIAYFLDERGETIGMIAAENLLDFLLQSVGPGIYNKAIEDAKTLFKKQLEKHLGEWEVESNLLKKHD
jgi:uncharacterized protein (DUF2164 family)